MLIVTGRAAINLNAVKNFSAEGNQIIFVVDCGKDWRTESTVNFDSDEQALTAFKQIISAYVAGEKIVKL